MDSGNGLHNNIIFFIFSALEIERRALHMVVTCSASELHSQFYVNVLHTTEVHTKNGNNGKFYIQLFYHNKTLHLKL